MNKRCQLSQLNKLFDSGNQVKTLGNKNKIIQTASAPKEEQMESLPSGREHSEFEHFSHRNSPRTPEARKDHGTPGSCERTGGVPRQSINASEKL